MVTVRYTTYDRMQNKYVNIINPVYKRVSIFQLPVSNKYCFRNYNVECGLNIYDYVKVWADCLKIGLSDEDAYITDNDLDKVICEKLFVRFNNSDILDYNARSLSVSDVICIANVEQDTRNFYYINGNGIVALDGDLFAQPLN